MHIFNARISSKQKEKISKFATAAVAILLTFVLCVQPLGYSAYAAESEENGGTTEQTDQANNDADAVASDSSSDEADNENATNQEETNKVAEEDQNESSEVSSISHNESNDYGIMPMGLTHSVLDGKATINNAQVAYAYFTDEDDAQNAEFNQVQNGENVHIDCFATSGYIENWSYHSPHNGYVVFFVKPNDGYLLTGLNADGSGDLYSLNGSLGEISDYPGIQQLVSKAKAEGYVAAFGYSRTSGNGRNNDVNANFLVDGYKPALTVNATVDKQQNVVPGDTLTFSVTISPATRTDDDRPLSIEEINLDSLTINGRSYPLENIVRNSDGSITGTVQYVATEEDCNSGSVTLDAQASVYYAYSFKGDDGDIISRTMVSTSGQTTCTIAAKQGVVYSYSGDDLPEEVIKTLPSDDKQYYPGAEVTIQAPTDLRVDVENKNGYYTFNGWTVNGESVSAGQNVIISNNSLFIDGSWTFHPYKNISDSTEVTIAPPANTAYSGSEQKLKPTIKTFEGTLLAEGSDYELSWSPDATNAGTVTVTITGKGDYRGTKGVTYAIEQAPLTVTTPSASKVYDGIPLTATDGASLEGLVNNETAELSVTGSVTNVSDENNGAEGNNTYTINWNGTANQNNYKVVEENLGTLTVTAATAIDPEDPEKNLVEVAAPANTTYNGKEQYKAPTITIKGSETTLEEGTDFTVDYGESDTINVGTVEATVNFQGNYSGTAPYSYAIEQAPLTVTTPSASKVYDGIPLTATDGASLEGLVNNETAELSVTGSVTNVSDENNGAEGNNTYTINWNGTANQNNYKVVEENLGTLTVTAATAIDPEDPEKNLVEVAAPANTTYNGKEQYKAPTITIKGSETTLEEGTDFTVDYGESDTINVGTVEATVNFQGNYSGTAPYSYAIEQAPLTVTTPSASKVYDGIPLTATDGASLEGLVNNETAELSVTGSVTNVSDENNGAEGNNTYTINWNGTANQNNYKVVEENLGTLTVTAATAIDPEDPEKNLVEVAAPANTTYNGKEQYKAPTITIKGSETTLEEGTDFTVDYGESDTINVGTVEATVNFQGNYSGTAPYSYAIEQAPLTVTTPSASKVYDGIPLTATDGASLEGLVNNETAELSVTGSVTNVSDENNGAEGNNTYTINWNGTANQNNYKVVEENLGTLTVTAATAIDPEDPEKNLVEVAAPANTTYNGKEQYKEPVVTLNDENKTALVKDIDYKIVWAEGTEWTNAGVKNGTVEFTGNYSGEYPFSYQIAAKEISATIPDQSKVYDGSDAVSTDPDAQLALTLDGVIGDDEVSATIAASAVKYAQAGVHEKAPLVANAQDVVLAGAQSGNYSVTSVSGNGSITAAPAQDTSEGTTGNTDNNGTDQDNSSSLVKTSDMVMPGVVIGIVLIAAACVAFAAYKSRRPRGRHTK